MKPTSVTVGLAGKDKKTRDRTEDVGQGEKRKGTKFRIFECL